MSQANDGGPAFPRPASPMSFDGGREYDPQHGMSLRDWFAGQALAGMLASTANIPEHADPHKIVATAAYLVADAMLKAREARP